MVQSVEEYASDVASRSRNSKVTFFSSLGALREDEELITRMKKYSKAALSRGGARSAPFCVLMSNERARSAAKTH
jgi:hypothetical protein